MSEPITTNSIIAKSVTSLGTHITLIGTWLASVAGWVSPVLGLLAAIILVAYYIYKWIKEAKKLNLEIQIKETELERLKKFKIHPKKEKE
jgi:hypothetical protein